MTGTALVSRERSESPCEPRGFPGQSGRIPFFKQALQVGFQFRFLFLERLNNAGGYLLGR